MMLRSRRTVGFIVCAVSAAACAPDQVTPPEQSTSPRREVSTVRPAKIRPEEAWLFQLEAKDDGFGGMYVSRDGVVHLFTRHPERQAALRGAWSALAARELRGALGEVQRGIGTSVALETGVYSISELASYRDRLFDAVNAGDLPGWSFLDLSEQTNRVALGIVSEADRGAARRLLQKLAIPEASVTLRVEPRPVNVTATALSASRLFVPPYITDQASTIVGGLGITWESASGGSPWICTSGFIARTGSYTRVVTASHCSEQEWVVDGAIMRQSPSERAIATETEDPPYYVCGTRHCRGSDAGMYTLYSGIPAERGLLAKTTGIGALTWDTSNPYWYITDVERNNMYSGLGLYKQGMPLATRMGTSRTPAGTTHRTS